MKETFEFIFLSLMHRFDDGFYLFPIVFMAFLFLMRLMKSLFGMGGRNNV